MIYEYAIDPRLFFEWCRTVRDCRQFSREFGIGSPRFISSYPKAKKSKWYGYIMSHKPSDLTDMDEKRLEELLSEFSKMRLIRENSHFEGNGWIQEVFLEHARLAFDGIFLSEGQTKGQDACFGTKDVFETNCDRWNKPRMLAPNRTAQALADSISGLLRLSNNIFIIDPYGYKDAGIASFKAFLSLMMANRLNSGRPSVTVMFNAQKGSARHIHASLFDPTAGYDLQVVGVAEKPDGEKFHNRYVLSELGGISFGVGTDEGEAHHTDDLVLLDQKAYELRWDQYAANPVFDYVDVAT